MIEFCLDHPRRGPSILKVFEAGDPLLELEKGLVSTSEMSQWLTYYWVQQCQLVLTLPFPDFVEVEATTGDDLACRVLKGDAS
jgi:hypothetical protein